MALPLEDAERAAHGLRAQAFQRGATVHEDLLDVELSHVHPPLLVLGEVLGVGDRRPQQLGDRPCGRLGAQLQQRRGFLNIPAADQVRHEAHLLRRRLQVPESGDCFHRSRLSLQLPGARSALSPAAGMPAEGTCLSELSELVADHVLADEDRNELHPVVNGDGVTHHLRNDRRPA